MGQFKKSRLEISQAKANIHKKLSLCVIIWELSGRPPKSEEQGVKTAKYTKSVAHRRKRTVYPRIPIS